MKLQSAFRGYAQRKQYKERLNYLKDQAPDVVKIQVTLVTSQWGMSEVSDFAILSLVACDGYESEAKMS